MIEKLDLQQIDMDENPGGIEIWIKIKNPGLNRDSERLYKVLIAS